MAVDGSQSLKAATVDEEGDIEGERENGAGVAVDRSSLRDLILALRRTLRFHRQMGIESYPFSPGLRQWLSPPRTKPAPAKSATESTGPSVRPEPPRPEGGTVQARLEDLRTEIDACACPLSAARQGVVPGCGCSGATLLVVGDYSLQQGSFTETVCFGEAEDPMLWNMMRAIGLAQANVYVTNAVKCCPLFGEMPSDDCLRSCRAHLMREIEWVRPRVVCAMGEMAARTLLGGEEPVLRLRGRYHTLQPAGHGSEPLPLMVTLHPRFLLKNAEMKKAAWQDLQMIQRLLVAR